MRARQRKPFVVALSRHLALVRLAAAFKNEFLAQQLEPYTVV